jgi:hypothetical protein
MNPLAGKPVAFFIRKCEVTQIGAPHYRKDFYTWGIYLENGVAKVLGKNFEEISGVGRHMARHYPHIFRTLLWNLNRQPQDQATRAVFIPDKRRRRDPDYKPDRDVPNYIETPTPLTEKERAILWNTIFTRYEARDRRIKRAAEKAKLAIPQQDSNRNEHKTPQPSVESIQLPVYTVSDERMNSSPVPSGFSPAVFKDLPRH